MSLNMLKEFSYKVSDFAKGRPGNLNDGKAYEAIPDFVFLSDVASTSDLDGLPQEEGSFIAGKGANLLHSRRLGIPVPDGFIIPLTIAKYGLNRRYPEEFERKIKVEESEEENT